MRVGEAHPAGRQGVEVRRWNLRLGVIDAEIADAEVVGQDDDHVGRRLLRRCCLGRVVTGYGDEKKNEEIKATEA